MGVHWSTADVALTRFSVKDYDRQYLRELQRAAVVYECVGARLVEIRHV